MTTETDQRQVRATGARPVVASTFVTLDGYMVGPDEDMSWVATGFDREMLADLAADMAGEFGVFVFGRVTYEIFAAYWPTAVPYDDGDEIDPAGGREHPDVIRALNEFPKVVFSTTMQAPEWSNTRAVAGGVEEEILRLRAQPGKAIDIQGSASIVQALARADLIDEYRLYVHPVLLGDGKRLFATGPARQDFELARSKPYANGVVAMNYTRKAVR